VGSNPRKEAPLVNTRIRKAWLHGELEIGVIGAAVDLTYDYDHIGAHASDLEVFLKSNKGFARKLKSAKHPMILIGQGVLNGPKADQILRLCGKIAEKYKMVREDWNGFNVLHTAASRVAGLDMGFLPAQDGLATAGILEGCKSGAIKTVYALGVDEIPASEFGDAFVIYQGSHGDQGAHRADVIFPDAAYTEKDALWVNTEGRVQMGFRAVPPKGEAKDSWAILRALSEHCGRVLPYDSLDALRQKLFSDHPTFAAINHAPGAEGAKAFNPAKLGKAGKVGKTVMATPIDNFYFTNPIARASKVMADCSAIKSPMSEAAE
ncbi:MAG TPA: NADH-quinone oxidoreductase subunit G, partial [Hellea balneolensis]|nr:NADH-quinone oxidoreductase subunit G [Hellea balneolensis]